jgi:hypothetical protein
MDGPGQFFRHGERSATITMVTRTYRDLKKVPKRSEMERGYPMGEKEKTVGYQRLERFADVLSAAASI